MDWFQPYESDLAEVFAECGAVIADFPPPLDQMGLRYMRQFDVFEQGSAKNYICYLLPFWMKDLTSLPPAVYRKLSVANIFGMLYFFIQDDIMDTAPEEYRPGQWKFQLALANLLQSEFIRLYQEFFPSDSPFWSYLRNYVQEWAEGVIYECDYDDFRHHPIGIAKKAAPVKLGSTAALLLANRSDLIAQASEFMDHVLLTLQMMDDWADWEQDLADGSYNCLLSLIKAENNLTKDHRLSRAEAEQAIYLNETLRRYAEIASDTHHRLLDSPIHAPHVLSFHQTLLNELNADADSIENGRKMLEHGGLNYYLSILNKK
ncbi:class 1 isoprenoid biosynthesis enzyme [Paenibacillus sp. DMB20]|uniref:class 1 isoprenoid biosynthesis enzyme n=1 Tax=Paenibacillus sp. DMB20 TaxID=1642570 RepID=UPI0006282007|nr:class 1 isoprenoid biosynthesis enzyme [Paenibacillus sp. DMB20]KKO54245.1 hypothetical protein XI25_09370 [Paenibacillus sp. DMB20]